MDGHGHSDDEDEDHGELMTTTSCARALMSVAVALGVGDDGDADNPEELLARVANSQLVRSLPQADGQREVCEQLARVAREWGLMERDWVHSVVNLEMQATHQTTVYGVPYFASSDVAPEFVDDPVPEGDALTPRLSPRLSVSLTESRPMQRVRRVAAMMLNRKMRVGHLQKIDLRGSQFAVGSSGCAGHGDADALQRSLQASLVDLINSSHYSWKEMDHNTRGRLIRLIHKEPLDAFELVMSLERKEPWERGLQAGEATGEFERMVRGKVFLTRDLSLDATQRYHAVVGIDKGGTSYARTATGRLYMRIQRHSEQEDVAIEDAWVEELSEESQTNAPAHWSCDDIELSADLFITNQAGEQLQDCAGTVSVSSEQIAGQTWRFADAGGGFVFITSHRGQQLEDFGLRVEHQSSDKDVATASLCVSHKWSMLEVEPGLWRFDSQHGRLLGDNQQPILVAHARYSVANFDSCAAGLEKESLWHVLDAHSPRRENWTPNFTGSCDVFLRSSQGRYLEEHHGIVRLSSASVGRSHRWRIADAGMDSYIITSHSGRQLQERWGADQGGVSEGSVEVHHHPGRCIRWHLHEARDNDGICITGSRGLQLGHFEDGAVGLHANTATCTKWTIARADGAAAHRSSLEHVCSVNGAAAQFRNLNGFYRAIGVSKQDSKYQKINGQEVILHSHGMWCLLSHKGAEPAFCKDSPEELPPVGFWQQNSGDANTVPSSGVMVTRGTSDQSCQNYLEPTYESNEKKVCARVGDESAVMLQLQLDRDSTAEILAKTQRRTDIYRRLLGRVARFEAALSSEQEVRGPEVVGRRREQREDFMQWVLEKVGGVEDEVAEASADIQPPTAVAASSESPADLGTSSSWLSWLGADAKSAAAPTAVESGA